MVGRVKKRPRVAARLPSTNEVSFGAPRCLWVSVVEAGNLCILCSHRARCAQPRTESASDLFSKLATVLAIFSVLRSDPGDRASNANLLEGCASAAWLPKGVASVWLFDPVVKERIAARLDSLERGALIPPSSNQSDSLAGALLMASSAPVSP